MSALMHARVLSPILAMTLVLAGCAGDGPAPDTGTDWFTRLQRDVLDVNCLGAGCHNSQSQAGGLVLSEGFSYDALVDTEPTNPAALAAGLLRVTPFDTANSFLHIKLTEPGPGQGDRMPQGQPPLSPDDLDIVTQWILNGAPPAQTPSGPVATVTPTTTASATTTDTPPLPTATPTTPAVTSPSATTPPDVTVTASPTSPDVTATASPSPTATQGVTLADVQSQVFTPNCLTAFCHTASAQAGGLVLEDGASHAALVNVPAVNFDAMNDGLVRVAPGDPDASFLYIKLTGPTLPQGSRMPMGQPPLAENLIALVRAWIEQGAQP